MIDIAVFLEQLPNLLTLTGLSATVVGAGILWKSSGRLYDFIMEHLAKSVPDGFDEKAKKTMKKQKSDSSWGISLIFWGFLVQVIGILGIIV